MPGTPWINDEPKLRRWAAEGVDPDTIAARLGRSYDGVRVYAGTRSIRLAPRLPPGERAAAVGAAEREPSAEAAPVREGIDQEFGGDTGRLSSRGRIATVEELLEKAAVDLAVWEVERYVVNQWEVGAKDDSGAIQVEPLYQIKAWLRRKRGLNSGELRDALLADLREHAPVYPKYRAKPASSAPHLLELCLFDPHFGKFAWGKETGEDYDLRIASERFLWAVETLLERARGFPVERILFPVGNDAIHADNAENTTTRGTRQDVDTRWFKLFRTARLVYQQAIDRCMEVAPVDVIVVPGNHDQQSALALGEVLDAQYSKTERVQVIGGPRLRKYYPYGRALIGFTHGSEEKPGSLPLLMATEAPELWAGSEYREWHTGHWHKRKETQFVGVDEHNGVRVRVISSLAGTDAWHFSQGYTQGWKAAEAFVWSPDQGLVGQFSANLGPYADREAA